MPAQAGRHTARFIALVNNNFHAHHDTSYYAGILCITPNYLNEIVQRTIGTSAKRYMQNRIIREAKKLLTYTDLAVAEISDRLHFENPSYFIRLFRQHTGLTPLRYRNDEKTLKSAISFLFLIRLENVPRSIFAWSG